LKNSKRDFTNRDSLYEKMYFSELDLRDKLNNQLQSLVTYATILVAWGAWVAGKVLSKPTDINLKYSGPELIPLFI
jgi:hypothetical protein